MSKDRKPAEVPVTHLGREVRVDLVYPRVEPNANSVVVGLIDVRSVDDIRISYDHIKCGWVIERERIDTIDGEDVSSWEEAAFISA